MRQLAAAFALAIAALLGAAGARAQPVPEFELKAAFLYNFALLTEWPVQAFPAPDAPFVLCVFGPNPFGNELARMEEKSVQGRRISVRTAGSPAAARDCHLLYIGPGEAGRLGRITESVGTLPVLTVADPGQSTPTEAVITLVQRDSRIGFSVDLASARRARLRLSSRLLKLAVNVRGE